MSDGSMTCAEAGRRGGLATSAKYGSDHFVALGKLTPPRARAFYRRVGKLGGDAAKAALSPTFYEEIGRLGGETLLAARGRDYFVEIGRLGAAARRARRAE